MFLPLTDEQRMLGESAHRYFARHPDHDLEGWAVQGWLAAAFDAETGGLGGTAATIAPLCEAIGATVACAPFFSAVLLPAMLLRRLPAGAQRDRWIAAMLEDGQGLAIAHCEDAAHFDPATDCTVRTDGEGRLFGQKRRVMSGANPSACIVSAGSGPHFGLHLVRGGAPGLSWPGGGAQVDLTWDDCTLSAVSSHCLATGETARNALTAAVDFALVGVLAESVGLMEFCLAQTRQWLSTRAQFGRPLIDNQTLQHRLADMLIACEEARSMLNMAIHAHDHAKGSQRKQALRFARVHIANGGRMVGQAAVHLHGAMGITEELAVARAYRRIEVLNVVFGGADFHLMRLVEEADAESGYGGRA